MFVYDHDSFQRHGVMPFEYVQNIKDIGFRKITTVSFDTNH